MGGFGADRLLTYPRNVLIKIAESKWPARTRYLIVGLYISNFNVENYYMTWFNKMKQIKIQTQEQRLHTIEKSSVLHF